MSLPSDTDTHTEVDTKTADTQTVATEAVDTEVLIVGAGPVGCWLAAELCAAGVRVLVLEARESRASWSRGFIIHPRTLEILASRGAVAPLLKLGRRVPTWHFAMGSRRLDFSVLPTAFPHILIQPQARTEELLEEHLNRCGGAVRRGQRFVGLTQHSDRVTALVRREGAAGADAAGHPEHAEYTVNARFVVGCDGARSTVRQAAGIGFSGSPDTLVTPHALVELADPPPPELHMQTREQGVFFGIPLPDGRFVLSTIDHAKMQDVETPWTAEMVRDSVRRITGTDYGMGEVERVSTLGNSAKQADRYRDRRVLLAGDAAHVHYPMGGQGMNLGVQDAHNLAWRLTAAVRAQREHPAMEAAEATEATDALLDGYEAERRPVGERVLEDVRAQMALVAAIGADGAALRSRFEALLFEHPEVNLQYARRLSGLDVRYPVAEGATGADASDARIGARVPDLELDLSAPAATSAGTTAGAAAPIGAPGPTRLYELLRAIGPGRFVHLTVTDSAADAAGTAADATAAGRPGAAGTPAPSPSAAVDGSAEAVTVVAGKVLGPDWALRDGWGGGPEAITIRPDGHVAGIRPLAAAAGSAPRPGHDPAFTG